MPNGIPTVDNAIDTGILIDRVANLELYISQTLVPALNSGQVPTGSIMPWAANGNLPTGFLLCNGASVSRTTYADLFNVIGTAFGTASGSTFNLPDFQGRFLRGRDNSAGRDPDAASRTAQNTGGATGDNVGSVQDSSIKQHYHGTPIHASYPNNFTRIFDNTNWDNVFSRINVGSSLPVTQKVASSNSSDGNQSTTMSTTGVINASGESRPINSYVNFIIKYTANVSL